MPEKQSDQQSEKPSDQQLLAKVKKAEREIVEVRGVLEERLGGSPQRAGRKPPPGDPGP